MLPASPTGKPVSWYEMENAISGRYLLIQDYGRIGVVVEKRDYSAEPGTTKTVRRFYLSDGDIEFAVTDAHMWLRHDPNEDTVEKLILKLKQGK